MRPVNRITPKLPPQAMKTYHIARPVLLQPDGTLGAGSHWRDADCKEADCGAYLRGWQTTIDVSRRARGGLPSGAQQANYIRLHSGRAFTVSQAGDLVTFTFPPGQRCFGRHRIPVGREPLFAVTGGDFRGNPRQIRPVRFRGHRQFIDDFGEHQSKLKERFDRG